jgi:hypothetical protein
MTMHCPHKLCQWPLRLNALGEPKAGKVWGTYISARNWQRFFINYHQDQKAPAAVHWHAWNWHQMVSDGAACSVQHAKLQLFQDTVLRLVLHRWESCTTKSGDAGTCCCTLESAIDTWHALSITHIHTFIIIWPDVRCQERLVVQCTGNEVVSYAVKASRVLEMKIWLDIGSLAWTIYIALTARIKCCCCYMQRIGFLGWWKFQSSVWVKVSCKVWHDHLGDLDEWWRWKGRGRGSGIQVR